MSKRFNDPELQKLWEEYEDYVADKIGLAYHIMSWQEWRARHGE